MERRPCVASLTRAKSGMLAHIHPPKRPLRAPMRPFVAFLGASAAPAAHRSLRVLARCLGLRRGRSPVARGRAPPPAPGRCGGPVGPCCPPLCGGPRARPRFRLGPFFAACGLAAGVLALVGCARPLAVALVPAGSPSPPSRLRAAAAGPSGPCPRSSLAGRGVGWRAHAPALAAPPPPPPGSWGLGAVVSPARFGCLSAAVGKGFVSLPGPSGACGFAAVVHGTRFALPSVTARKKRAGLPTRSCCLLA